ncbi:MAG: hypothetical protein IJP81_10740 [Bacteroidales bacterium]|nr:hypothetical protein [Bacteroidales bacterium]
MKEMLEALMSTGKKRRKQIMKKTLAILSALVALMACSKEAPVVEEPTQKEKQEIKVNITISRTEMDAETKANIKSGWANDDVVYVFFSEATAPAYLEMKYNSSTGWTATPKNELNLATLEGTGTMWAVYLPYGNEYTVLAADEDSYTIKSKATDGENYSGHFFYCEPQDYTISESTLSGKISLSVAAPKTEGDVLVHFDVTNPVAGSEYLMYQEYMKPMSLSSISAAGIINKAVGALGDAIPGYKDASFVSFSGVLDKNYKGDNSYWISIRDTELGTLYYRDAGSHAISANKYIGLGSLTSVWTVATPGAFSVSDTKQITFARSNLSYLGATGGSKPWQLMKYPWSRIEASGTFTPSASVDFSLFAWATSGYNPFGLAGGNDPWRNEAYTGPYDGVAANFGPRINGNHPGVEWSYVNTENPEDANAQGGSIQWDWARKDGNVIYEYGGGNAIIGYRTPTKDEYVYIINTRTDDYRYAKACVAGVNGLIIFPEGFNPGSSVTINSKNTDNVSFGTNDLTDIVWNKIEAMGAVFLPCAGYLNPSSHNIVNYNSYAGYWTSTIADSAYSWNCRIENSCLIANNGTLRALGMSVRLVHDIN